MLVHILYDLYVSTLLTIIVRVSSINQAIVQRGWAT